MHRRRPGVSTAEAVKFAALVLPLGLDTLGVALALGLAGLPHGQRLRVSLLFAAFEAAMPLLGIALGAPLGRAIGDLADYLAALMIIALGIYMLITEGEPQERLLTLTEGGVLGALALGVAISLDELAIGFSAGLLGLPVLPLVIAVCAQAFLLTQIGLRVGDRVGARLRESAERLAGVALLALGVILLAVNLA